MPSILTQKELRDARDQDFCYLCGELFKTSYKQSPDHVPPRAIFAKPDRDPPLILPTHQTCNQDRSVEDEIIGQLVAVLHGKYPPEDQLKLALLLFDRGPNRSPRAGLHDIPLVRIIYRWVRGFHAALYGQCLPDEGGYIYTPFPVHIKKDGVFKPLDDDSGRYTLTATFKQHMKLGRVDQILCCNKKCDYRCTWMEFDDGRPFCLFVLRLYNWEELGDPTMPPKRGCLGWYFAEPPANATRGTRVEVAISNLEPLDPFGA